MLTASRASDLVALGYQLEINACTPEHARRQLLKMMFHDPRECLVLCGRAGNA